MAGRQAPRETVADNDAAYRALSNGAPAVEIGVAEIVSGNPTFRRLPGKRSAYVARINETDAGAGMSLRIRFTNKTDYGPAIALGEITLNDFAETFETPLTFWSAERYERQWREGVDRLRLGLSRSCLITSLIEPGPELFGIWWKLYHEGEQIVVQNQLLLASEFGNFNPDNPYGSIPERVSVNADGEPVSEWVLGFEEINAPPE